jgi:hypothetical protein
MRYRKLRIAWSVGCGILCLLLIGLWVRSYWRADVVVGPLFSGQAFSISSSCSELLIRNYQTPEGTTWDWGINSRNVDDSDADAREQMRTVTTLGFALIDWRPIGWMLILPHALLVILSGTLSLVPLIRCSRRFSLRTLLLGMTVSAVVLGLGVALIW